MVYNYGYVIKGKHKNKMGRIIDETPYFVYIQTDYGQIIKVSKKNVMFLNPRLEVQEVRSRTMEPKKKRPPKRISRRMILGRTGGRVEERKKVGREEYKFTGEGVLIYKGKHIQIYQGPRQEIYILPTVVDVIKEKVVYPLLTKWGEPSKTTVTRYRRVPLFREIMIPKRYLFELPKIIKDLNIPKYAKEELRKVISSWTKKGGK